MLRRVFINPFYKYIRPGPFYILAGHLYILNLFLNAYPLRSLALLSVWPRCTPSLFSPLLWFTSPLPSFLPPPLPFVNLFLILACQRNILDLLQSLIHYPRLLSVRVIPKPLLLSPTRAILHLAC